MKNLLLCLSIILGTICVFNANSHAGPVEFGTYQTAHNECYAAVQRLELAASDLMTSIKSFHDKEKNKNEENKAAGSPATWSKKEAKALSQSYKSRHLKFNKKIPD